jgi:hypothetical protein
MEWKNCRHGLDEVTRPDYTVDRCDELFERFYNPDPYPRQTPQSISGHVLGSSSTLSSGNSNKGSKKTLKVVIKGSSGHGGSSRELKKSVVVKSSSGHRPLSRECTDSEEGVEDEEDEEGLDSDHEFHSDYNVRHGDVSLMKPPMTGLKSTLSIAMQARGTLAFPLV